LVPRFTRGMMMLLFYARRRRANFLRLEGRIP
jgi:hypothetical protein